MVVGKRPKRSAVLFLVEGMSEKKALELAVDKLYDQIDKNIVVKFLMMDGDVTSTRYTDRLGNSGWISSDTIGAAIYDKFLKEFSKKLEKGCNKTENDSRNESIMLKEVSSIIHIVDTDGAFVSDEMVKLVTNIEKEKFHLDKCKPYIKKGRFYSEEGIFCVDVKKVDNIKKRNEHKSKILKFLSSLEKIKIKTKDIPYSVYYFSCNLDHFLLNSANLDDKEKCEQAEGLSDDHANNPEGLVNLILQDPDSVYGIDYKESWEYIQQGNNSLQRLTNINLLFKELLEKIKKN